MKRSYALILILALTLSFLAACGGSKSSPSASVPAKSTEQASAPENGLAGKLKVWSFSNEVNIFATAFKAKNPNVEIEYTMVPMNQGEYQTKLQQSLSTGADVPDVCVLEIAFLRQYIESPFLSDLGALKHKAEQLETYSFTLDAATDNSGVLKGYAYQATPGALFYRRSLAKEYFGTDDPAEIQIILSDMDKFEKAATQVKDKSGGETYFIASAGDFTQTYFANRSQPWVVDNKLVIDPKIDEMWDVVKRFRENNFEAQTKQWEEGWFAPA